MRIELTNSEIKQIIDEKYRDERKRAIITDRIINGMTYQQIFEKHYKDRGFCPNTERDKRIEMINKMKLYIILEAKSRKENGELVRCGECKWFDREAFCESKSYGSCKLPLSHINTHCMIPEDYYCADGERKDGERDDRTD